MSTPYCECGRPAVAYVNHKPRRRRGQPWRRLPSHDLCQRCWESTIAKLKSAELTEGRMEPSWSWAAWLNLVRNTMHGRPIVQQLAFEIARHGLAASEAGDDHTFWPEDLPSAGQPWIGVALLELSRAGLLSRCPGVPLFTATMTPCPHGAEQQSTTEIVKPVFVATA